MKAVQVSGFKVGEVKSIELDGPRALVKFTVARNIQLGDRTEAAIKTRGLLGTKVLEVTSRGGGQLEGPIPVERTRSPYELPDALGELATTISGLNTNQLSDSLRVLAATFSDTPPQLRVAVEGVARFSQTLDERDEQLRGLLTNANKATTVLAERSNQVVSLIANSNALLTELRNPKRRTGSDLRQHLVAQRSTAGLHRREPRNPEACSRQAQRRADDRRQPQGTRAEGRSNCSGQYSMSLGESVSSGPFFKTYVANLLPGQFLQPFIDAAFSDLGLDPNVLLPSERTDPQIGQPGTPALPVPYPRTGQGGEPRLNIPDAITGNPGDQGAVCPECRCPAPAAIRTANRCRRPRPADRRRDRPPRRRRICSRPRNRLRHRSWCPLPARCPHLAPDGGRTMTRSARTFLAVALAVILAGGAVVLLRNTDRTNRTHVVAYFENSNGIYAGDDVRIVGVPVGQDRVHRAAAPAGQDLVLVRQQVQGSGRRQGRDPVADAGDRAGHSAHTRPTPSGPVMEDNAVIPRERTAVPVEWDEVRQQLEKLTETLQPTEPGGVSPLGSVINTAADNLRGEGANIRDTIIKLSQAVSALGDHSTDIFSTVKNLAILVSALQDSTDLMRQLNQNLATVTGLLANDPDEVANAVRDLNNVVGDVQTFVAENRETLGTTSDKLAGVTQALTDSLGDIKQVLHVAPNTLQNYVNIWQPAQGAVSSVPMLNNFANPISFLCGAIQAASRLGAEQSAKLCVQYLAPIIKNRQYNFLPLAQNVFVGATTRPNELTYSEDWLRPDYIPPQACSARQHTRRQRPWHRHRTRVRRWPPGVPRSPLKQRRLGAAAHTEPGRRPAPAFAWCRAGRVGP